MVSVPIAPVNLDNIQGTSNPRKKENDRKKVVTNFQSPDDTPLLLAIFPEEVWRFVLKPVDNSTDFQNISSSSALFCQLLKPNRVHGLLSSVAKVMFQLSCLTKESTGEKSWSFQDLLHLRQVCHSWQLGVDHALQNLDRHFLFNTDFTRRWSLHEPVTYSTCLIGVNTIQRCKVDLERTHLDSARNPFVTRHLKVFFGSFDYAQPEEVSYELLELLGVHGQHVWYFQINTHYDEYIDQFEFFMKFGYILKYMPNLKKLECSFQYPDFPQAQIAKLEQHIKSTDFFPVLPNLRFVEPGGMPVFMFEAFAVRNPTITSVQISGNSDGLSKYSLERIANLEAFSVTLMRTEDFLDLKACRFPCRLTTLHMVMHEIILVYFSWKSVFRMLESNFSESLNTLKIVLPVQKASDRNQSLNLPKLRTLLLQMDQPYALDFLLPMSANLEQVSVMLMKASFKQGADGEQKVKVYAHKDQLTKSNVWTLFPKLQQLTIDTRRGIQVCTRKNYMKAQKNA